MTVEGLLSGITVVDISENLPGPFLSQNLAELGAHVIKVERPHGEHARHASPGLFAAVNRTKEFRRIDLKTDDGRDELRGLISTADILIEGFRPGTLARLGLDPAQLTAEWPRLITVSLCGYSPDSEMRDEPGHDITYAAQSGVLSVAGPDPVTPAWAPGVPVADLTAAGYGLSACLAALYRREREGYGQRIVVPIVDAIAHFLNPRVGVYRHEGAQTVPAMRTATQQLPAYGIFTCADGEQLTIAALENHFWTSLVRALSLHDWEGPEWSDPGRRKSSAAAINESVRTSVARRPRGELLDLLRATDVPCAPVLDPFEALAQTTSSTATAAQTDGEAQYFRFPAAFRANR